MDDDSKPNNKINITFTTEMPINIANPIVLQSNKTKKEHPPPLQSNNYVITKGDSAASHHYWREQYTNILTDIIEDSGTSVLLPNRDTISASSKGILPISLKYLPKHALR